MSNKKRKASVEENSTPNRFLTPREGFEMTAQIALREQVLFISSRSLTGRDCPKDNEFPDPKEPNPRMLIVTHADGRPYPVHLLVLKTFPRGPEEPLLSNEWIDPVSGRKVVCLYRYQTGRTNGVLGPRMRTSGEQSDCEILAAKH